MAKKIKEKIERNSLIESEVEELRQYVSRNISRSECKVMLALIVEREELKRQLKTVIHNANMLNKDFMRHTSIIEKQKITITNLKSKNLNK